MVHNIDIAIIGGGAAGIAAARRIFRKGYSCILLEAAPRLGGRAWTVDRSGYPLDLGCGWLHSADRNQWVKLADTIGVSIERREAAWNTQYNNLGFSEAEQRQARIALREWERRLQAVATRSDRASDALNIGNRWNTYIKTFCGFSNGVSLDQMSATDYLAYDTMCSYRNWRIESGLGRMIAEILPSGITLSLATPVKAIMEYGRKLGIETPHGRLYARTIILTVSTHVLAKGAIRLPSSLDPWREAACNLPLGRNEKLFLHIEDSSLLAETHLLGDPHSTHTCDFYIHPFGWPIIECFLGGDSARIAAERGSAEVFALATDQLVSLLGSSVRTKLKLVAASCWTRSPLIGGGYSSALPGQAAARSALSKAWNRRIFFAGEATSTHDFATVHGAYESGVRTADAAIAALEGRHGSLSEIGYS